MPMGKKIRHYEKQKALFPSPFSFLSKQIHKYENKSYLQFDKWWRANSLFEHMLTDLHVIFTHHYVLDYLYHMFDDAMKAIGRRETSYYGSVGGNYDGTFIEWFAID